ncbi:MAG: hypothetical protein Q4B86_00420 [Eubacteriales bacterium]|nr:hypothetical protein [Eubacteriales bacterium]
MKLHDICYGNASIGEAIEKISQFDDDTIDQKIQSIEEQLTDRKNAFLSQKMNIKITKEKNSIIGYIEGKEYKNIQKRKLYQPEKMLRRLTLFDNLK